MHASMYHTKKCSLEPPMPRISKENAYKKTIVNPRSLPVAFAVNRLKIAENK